MKIIEMHGTQGVRRFGDQDGYGSGDWNMYGVGRGCGICDGLEIGTGLGDGNGGGCGYLITMDCGDGYGSGYGHTDGNGSTGWTP